MKSLHISRFKIHVSRWLLVFLVTAIILIPHASAQVVEIPDPNLRQAIRETLQLPDGVPITQQEMERLRDLDASQREMTSPGWSLRVVYQGQLER